MTTADRRASDARGIDPVGRGFPPALPSWALPLALAALAAAVYVGLRVWALGGFAPGNRAVGMDATSSVLTAANLFVRYVAKLAWPSPLQALYPFHPVGSVFSWPALIGLLGVTAVACGLWRLRHRPVLLVGASLFILPLLPVRYVPSVRGRPEGEAGVGRGLDRARAHLHGAGTP